MGLVESGRSGGRLFESIAATHELESKF